MAKEKRKHLLTAFTPERDYLAVLSTNGTVKVWNTSDGSQFAEWKNSEENLSFTVSCLACIFKQKKRRKEQSTCLVALGMDGGDIFVVNISTGQIMWKSARSHSSGAAHLSFTNEGHRLYAISNGGMVHEMNCKTGEVTREFKLSKKLISSATILPEDRMIAAVGNKIGVFSLEDGKELLKFSSSLGPAKYISSSGDAKTIVACGFHEKQLQVWKCDLSTSTASSGPVLSMKHPPLSIEFNSGCDGGDGGVVLSVSEKGVAYFWNLKSASQEVNPSKITVKSIRSKTDSHDERGRAKKDHIIAAKVDSLATDGQVRVLVAYGSVDSLHFTFLDLANPGEDIAIALGDETTEAVTAVQENGIRIDKGTAIQNEKKKKRSASDLDISAELQTVHEDPVDRTQVDYDLNEPTMGEKLANLNLVENNEPMALEDTQHSAHTKPPSADSVHVLLKQALHADDRVFLIDCLYRQDEKVIANTVSKLNPSDVLKLLQSLVSIIQSRGAVLSCTLPWLRSLLLQHASGIMSQESSLHALNSLYQLIESRVSTFNQALKLSSSLDLLYAGNADEGEEESDGTMPVIYEDEDESDEEADEMDTGSDDEDEKEPENLSGVSDFEDME